MSDIRAKKRKAAQDKYIDAQASYTVLDECLKFLSMNNMEELKSVKKEIKRTMNELKEIDINGKRR